MLLKHALAEYLLEIEIRKYTPKTIRSYRNNLNLFVRYLTEEAEIDEVEELTLAAVRRFSLYMVERGKKGTYINGLLKTAKSFIQYGHLHPPVRPVRQRHPLPGLHRRGRIRGRADLGG